MEMTKEETRLAVARYVVDNSKTLRGMLGTEHYFNLGGRAMGEDAGSSFYETFKGFAIDILAEAMNKGTFFGCYVPSAHQQACNCNNAKLIPLKQGRGIITLEDFTETPEGLLVRVPIVKPKDWLNVLRNEADFKKYSDMVDLRSGFGQEQKTPKGIKSSIESLFASK